MLLVLPNAGDVFPTQTVPLNISRAPASLMPTGSVLNAVKCRLSFNRRFLRDVAQVPQAPCVPAFLAESGKAVWCFLLTPVTEHTPFDVLLPLQSCVLEPEGFATNPASASRPHCCHWPLQACGSGVGRRTMSLGWRVWKTEPCPALEGA